MKQRKAKLIVEKRKIYKFGGSFGILLPKEFVQAHNLKEGDEIPVLANHILKIVPMSEEK
jgi:antitoxin component of MazEF toxin-antitoxin module